MLVRFYLSKFNKMKWIFLLGAMHLFVLKANAQAFARNWDAWYGQLQVGAANGMQQTSPSYALGLYKSVENHGFGLDFGGVTLGESKIIYGTLSASQDLMRLTRNRRSRLYLYGSVGLGLTHLRNPILQDNFLLQGDDMLHAQLGLSPTYFINKDFALQLSGKYQFQALTDFELDRLWSVQLGLFFLLPDFKPF